MSFLRNMGCGCGDNDEILFFILIFLLLFSDVFNCGCNNRRSCDDECGNDSSILFFIILFLLLFNGGNCGCGNNNCGCN